MQGIVLRRKGDNPDEVIKSVRKKIEEIGKLLPPGVELRPYYNRVSSTALTLLVLPAVYALFARRHPDDPVASPAETATG